MKLVFLSSLLLIVLAGCTIDQANTPAATPTDLTGSGEEVMNLQVTVVLTDDVARALHGLAPATDESKELVQSLEALGATLVPMHPGVEDPTLLTFFTVTVPDQDTADRVISKLQQLPVVEGVYVKPPDEPPQ